MKVMGKAPRFLRPGVARAGMALVLGLALGPAIVWALDCQWCQERLSAREAKEREIAKNDGLLGKNRQYLTYLDPSEVSKFIKVDSNIKMILVKRERLKRELASVEGEWSEKGCESCQKQ